MSGTILLAMVIGDLICAAGGIWIGFMIANVKRGPRPTGETYVPKNEEDVPWPP